MTYRGTLSVNGADLQYQTEGHKVITMDYHMSLVIALFCPYN